ncbi:hypothetical protein [Cohnella thailandensis]|uniref:Uncharacterized protein n=1 Tax=Cohnella thailandensis TaxID=557557 RepID=A0A841SXD6_9BACL|nr:hypothetical protein [Cohnella thailandensis]MBB6634838.1 hypothetical protein [Cohnella thailandensis]MBP1975941.1 glucan phosphoethanolaminetransferase (alkaline phosphatase superfamily) [Cohnella thailandensis]
MKNVKTALYLLLSQFIYLLMCAPWFLVALTSIMAFADPNALSSIAGLGLMFFVWLYPAAFVGAAVTCWIFYHKGKFKRAAWMNLLPLLWIVPLVLFFMYG